MGQDSAGNACVWQNNIINELPGGSGGCAYAVNNSGEIVGQDSAGNACVWQNNIMNELPGGRGSCAYGVNGIGWR